jgi:hypothetical protein
MIMRYILIVALLCGQFILSMENSGFAQLEIGVRFQISFAVKRHLTFERVALEMRELGKKDTAWSQTLHSKELTGYVLNQVSRELDKYSFFSNGFDSTIRNSEGFHKACAAAVLGTPGAIEFGKEYIQKNDEAKKGLKDFLFDIVERGDKWNQLDGCLSWPDEDLDVVRAGLDMGLEPDMLGDARGWSSVNLPLLITAVEAQKVKVVELLLGRGANAWTRDTSGQCAFDYAADGFSKASEVDKEKYEKIIELLENAK